ncbi:threonylcarbamoyladenosine tRNA methylthiotransferase [Chiloscyllium plagiosum]|uniref:threonylcarbamoyladenosine tRNA methylthiotransferase n=1 Tax=Chiloscyllium plagiosum TaxID=36176 RepID=UPI001CB85140|nr:threonylcarbamoyladenosine tRNA methylthiotransferase [Chiloscyllium plagiosum]
MPAACDSLVEDIEDIVSAQDPTPHDQQFAKRSIVPHVRKRKKHQQDEGTDDVQADSVIPGAQKIWVKTWGCSHNSSDGEYMAGQLAVYGYKITDNSSNADLWLLNSCTVKNPAEDHFRNTIKKAQEQNKKVVVAGCVPQAQPRMDYIKGLSIIGVQQIDRVVEVVEETIKGHSVRLLGQKKDKGKRLGGARLDLPKIRKNPLIEIISVNTGCLNACTYCKTKHARGELASYSVAELVDRAIQSFQEGICEIWSEMGLVNDDHTIFSSIKNSSHNDAIFTHIQKDLTVTILEYVEQSLFHSYTGTILHLFLCYISDCIDTASCSHEELERFHYTYVFHPDLRFIWIISDTSLSFLALSVFIDLHTTDKYFKPTKSHRGILVKEFMECVKDCFLDQYVGAPARKRAILDLEMAKILCHPRVYSFLHVPVQTGSDSVLMDMKREYCIADFKLVVNFLKKQVPGITIATDIICGFPGETEADFQETLKLIQEYKFPSLFINQFYPRPGTPAAKMEQVPAQVKKQRTRMLSQLFQSYTPYDHKIGEKQHVLITEESFDGQYYVAHNKFYEQVLVPKQPELLGKMIEVDIYEAGKHFMKGKPAQNGKIYTPSIVKPLLRGAVSGMMEEFKTINENAHYRWSSEKSFSASLLPWNLKCPRVKIVSLSLAVLAVIMAVTIAIFR